MYSSQYVRLKRSITSEGPTSNLLRSYGMPPKRSNRKRTFNDLVGSVPDAKLSDIIKEVLRLERNGELNCGTSARTLYDELYADVDHLVESVPMQLKGGGEASWELLEPNRLLAYVVESCPELADAFGRAANEHLPTLENPWHIVSCFDEFTPGHKMKSFSSRKSMVMGYNFVDLGEEILTKDYSLIIPVVTPTHLMNDFVGGWSNMLGLFFHMQLFGSQGLLTAGVTLMIDGQALTIYANVRHIGGDYDGIRIGWDWKGANSIRACLKCSNCFKKDSDLAGRIDGGVDITCTDKGALIERTSKEFEHDVDLVSEAGAALALGQMESDSFDLESNCNWTKLQSSGLRL